MTWKRDGDTITLEMSHFDYDSLLIMLGYATGAAARDKDEELFWRFIKFVNELNASNPHFRPYETPPDAPSKDATQ